MRKDDLTVGELYAADGPGKSYKCALLVRVRVVEIGVVADSRRLTGALNGSRVCVEQDIPAHKRGIWDVEALAAGDEYVVANKRIAHEWTDADDERVVSEALAADRREEMRAALTAIGLPEAFSLDDLPREERAERVAQGCADGVSYDELYSEPGFSVRGTNTVVIDFDVLDAWLRQRVDVSGAEAIDRFVAAWRAEAPWTGPADLGDPIVARFRRDATVRP